jgi:hypothetical protein
MLLGGQRYLQYGNKTLRLKKVDTTICVHTKAGNKTLSLSKSGNKNLCRLKNGNKKLCLEK